MSLSRRIDLVGISRQSLYYTPTDKAEDKRVMDVIDTIFTKRPIYGVPKMRVVLARDHGIHAGIDRVRRLMRLMGLMAIYPKPNLSKPNKGSHIYPYLLKGFHITRLNQVWATDITYIKLAHRWAYLIAIIDWFFRYVISWRLSPSLELPFCLEAIDEALSRHGRTRDLQLRPRQPFHRPWVDCTTEKRAHENQHGWTGQMHGQYLYRAILAVA